MVLIIPYIALPLLVNLRSYKMIAIWLDFLCNESGMTVLYQQCIQPYKSSISRNTKCALAFVDLVTYSV